MYCVNCGAAIMPGSRFCVSCGKPQSGAAAQSVGGGAAVAPAPIPQPVPSFSFSGYAGTPGEYVGIGFWPRAGARIIDLIVHYVIYIAGAFLFGIMLGIVAVANHVPIEQYTRKMGELTASGFLLALLGSVLYETIMEAGAGATLGKLMIGAVVVQEDGTPCQAKSAFIRSLAYFLDSFFFGVIGYMEMNKTPRQQRYGDKWGKTLVIAKAQAPAGSFGGGGRFFAMLVLACLADAATAILSFAVKLA